MLRLLYNIISYKFQEYVRQLHPVPPRQEFQWQQEVDYPAAEEQPHHVRRTQSLCQSASAGKLVSTSNFKLEEYRYFSDWSLPYKTVFR